MRLFCDAVSPAQPAAVGDLVQTLADAAVDGETGVAVEEGGAAGGGHVVRVDAGVCAARRSRVSG